MLLAKAWVAHTIEVDNLVEGEGDPALQGRFRISLAMWANGLRVIDEAGTALGEARSRARAECNIGGLERWGWITVDDGNVGPGARRDGYGTSRGLRPGTLLRPTRAGETARRLWPMAVDTVESRWVQRFGSDVVAALRSALAGLGPSMPWSPPQVGPSNGFRAVVVASEEGAIPGELPLVVLLGQALTALTLRSESGAMVSRPIGENLLGRLVGEDGESEGVGVAVKDLPATAGLSKEAVAMASNFAVRRGLAELGSGRILSLSGPGRAALADLRARGALETEPALRSALEAVLGQPRSLAAGLEPPPGGWRSERPYAAQTRRLLADPVGALPRHPMVLHRGGWPDGS